MKIQLRRLPRKGGANRSINGAHANLNVYGMPTRETSPTVLKLTFSSVIQAWRVEPIIRRGSPEESPKKRFTNIRQLRRVSHKDGRTVLVADPLVSNLTIGRDDIAVRCDHRVVGDRSTRP